MKIIARSILLILTIILPLLSDATLKIGVGKTDIIPPIGTPSAGYAVRQGTGMQGIHDPLLATALFIDNGDRQIVLCSVDHLGFTYKMCQEIIQCVQITPGLEYCNVYIGSSHTHSGGGAYLDLPPIGETLAGSYHSEMVKFYIEKTVEAIMQASQQAVPAKIGIGYGKADLSQYRGTFPKDRLPIPDVAAIKVTKLDETPLAILFNYAMHPTILKSENLLFSSDFVGYTRDHLQSLLGHEVQPIYFNGAQGDIIPLIFNEEDRVDSCKATGNSLAKTVAKIWDTIEVCDSIDISTQKESYSFKPQATPFGLKLPLEEYKSEMNLIVLNKMHAFITIPGELSSIYDQQLKAIGCELGYSHVSILGLVNDAHGYIILPESWKHKTLESNLSFGGECYGELIKKRAEALLKSKAPK